MPQKEQVRTVSKPFFQCRSQQASKRRTLLRRAELTSPGTALSSAFPGFGRGSRAPCWSRDAGAAGPSRRGTPSSALLGLGPLCTLPLARRQPPPWGGSLSPGRSPSPLPAMPRAPEVRLPLLSLELAGARGQVPPALGQAGVVEALDAGLGPGLESRSALPACWISAHLSEPVPCRFGTAKRPQGTEMRSTQEGEGADSETALEPSCLNFVRSPFSSWNPDPQLLTVTPRSASFCSAGKFPTALPPTESDSVLPLNLTTDCLCLSF